MAPSVRRNPMGVTSEEVARLVALIEERARKICSHTVTISHQDLYQVLAVADMNRIRWQMKQEKPNSGIMGLEDGHNIAASYGAEGYTFALPDSFDVTERKTEEVPVMDVPVKNTKTFTAFKYPYIAPDNFKDIRIAVERGYKVLLVGPTGSGKSRLFEEIGAFKGQTTLRRSLSLVYEAGDLLGSMQIKNVEGVSVTSFTEGIMARAAREGWMLIFDEFDRMTSAANTAFQQISEDNGKIVLDTEDGFKVITPHPDFRMVFTSNTWGFGDDTGFFPNAQSQDRSFLNRLGPKFHLDYQPEVEKQLIKPLVKPAVLDALYHHEKDHPEKDGIVLLIRKACTAGTGNIDHQFGLRSILRFAELYDVYGWHKAAMYCIVHDFPPQFWSAVRDIVTQRWGGAYMPTEDTDFINSHKATLAAAGF